MRRIRTTAVLILLSVGIVVPGGVQSKLPPGAAEFGRWETVQAQPRGHFQVDYQRRILQWFGHCLKNEPAPSWITSGMSVLERAQELERASGQKGS